MNFGLKTLNQYHFPFYFRVNCSFAQAHNPIDNMAPLKVKVTTIHLNDSEKMKIHFEQQRSSRSIKSSQSIYSIKTLDRSPTASPGFRSSLRSPTLVMDQEIRRSTPGSPIMGSLKLRSSSNLAEQLKENKKKEEELFKIVREDPKPVEEVTELEKRLRAEMEKRTIKMEMEAAHKRKVQEAENEFMEKKKEMGRILAKKEYTMSDDGKVIMLLQPHKREKSDGRLPGDIVEVPCINSRKNTHETPLVYVNELNEFQL